jgi:hypothetical protein
MGEPVEQRMRPGLPVAAAWSRMRRWQSATGLAPRQHLTLKQMALADHAVAPSPILSSP